MKKLLAGLGLLLATSAMAADNAVVITPGVGVTTRSKDIGALVQLPGVFLSDQTGAFPGAFANYGTSPGAVLVPGVNAFVTNPVAVTQAAASVASGAYGSGAFASGSFASGSVASGAFASGALSSGSVASGAIASGAMVDLGAQADAACSTDNGTCSLIALAKRNNQNVALPATLSVATTGGCTGQVILSSATAIFTQVKASAGTLCWIRYQNSTATLLDVRVYDSATNGNAVCASATGVVSNDVAQANTTSPGMVGNLGTFGQAHANGIGICITGANTNTDTTSAITGLNLNIGFK